MDADQEFWRERWRTGQIGFHEGKPNAQLAAHVDEIAKMSRVLVPLAGKTRDMTFLRSRGHAVIGVELVESACRAFYEDDGVVPTVVDKGPFRVFRAAGEPHGVEMWCGDFFDATPKRIRLVDAVYDRAALVALPPALRAPYAASLAALVRPGGRVLLVTMAYDQNRVDGPPFSIDGAMVRALFRKHFVVEPRGEGTTPANARMQAAGIRELREIVTVLTRVPP